MSEIKTKPTDIDIDEFLMSIEPEKKRLDSIELKKVFDSVVEEKAALWNKRSIGQTRETQNQFRFMSLY